MTNVPETAALEVGKVLNDPSRPMKERFRALFTLRNLGGEAAIKCISDCFTDESVLLKHELAYCLGQMQDPRAIPKLRSVLEDKEQDPIVRHEAGKFVHTLFCTYAVINESKYLGFRLSISFVDFKGHFSEL